MLFAFYRIVCYSENRDTIMSFMDELNENKRTPEQIEEKLRESMESKASSQYRNIKNYMLLKAENGEYDIIGSKKRIMIYQELHFDLADLVKEEIVPVRQSTGFLNLQTRIVNKKRIAVNPSRRNEYEYFTKSIIEYGKKDGMEIVPVIYCRGENKDYTIPTPILGIYLAGFEFC